MPRRPALTEAERDRIIEMREAGRTMGQIARRIGCSVGSVAWLLLKAGVDPHADRPLPPIPTEPVIHIGPRRSFRRFTAAEDARLLALEAQGLSLHRIALALGRRRNSIEGRLNTLARRAARAEIQEAA